MSKYNIILIDNFDSFVYNLVDEIRCLGHELLVYRNDVPTSVIIEALRHSELPSLLVISPGPGSPRQAGNLLSLIALLRGQVPILGICLGHQAVVEAFGGKVVRAKETVHGKLSRITHNFQGPFHDLPQPLSVARYHSLVVDSIPDSLSVIASYQGLSMAVYSEEDKVLGFQFHPESILTPQGTQLLQQSLDLLAA